MAIDLADQESRFEMNVVPLLAPADFMGDDCCISDALHMVGSFL